MPTGLQSRPTMSSSLRIGLLSTYPPNLCGLATFAAALATELLGAGQHVDVVRIEEAQRPGSPACSARGELVHGVPGSARDAAAVLSACDVAIVQHEYGIYGGVDGDEVLEVLGALDVPAIVVLHTVPLEPTTHQRSVLESVCDLAGRVVVMTDTAGARLRGLYEVDDTKVVTIPHGAAALSGGLRVLAEPDAAPRPQLLTWGLLGPGKGIEHVIDALSLLDDLRPSLRYTVAGVTHPKVLARHGDQYRRSLIGRARLAGVSGAVTFDDTYRDVAALTRFVASSSLVVLPYDSRDQVTSGVLVDAIAAGRPVIATAFPHAVEMLGSGAGIVVPHGDPVALAAAIRSVITDPARLAAMSVEARRLAPSLRWSTVAAQYRELCDELLDIVEPVAM